MWSRDQRAVTAMPLVPNVSPLCDAPAVPARRGAASVVGSRASVLESSSVLERAGVLGTTPQVTLLEVLFLLPAHPIILAYACARASTHGSDVRLA